MAGLSRSHALFRTERQNREDAHLEEKRERLDIREAKDRERSRLRHHEVDTAYSVAPSPREPVFPGSGAVPAHSNPGEPTNRHSPRAGAALLSPGNGEAAQRPPSRSQSAAFSPPKSRPTTRSNSPMVGARRGNNSRTPTPVINTADVHSPSNPRSGSHSPPGLRRHARDRDSVGSPDSAGGSGRKPARAQVPPPQQPQVLLPQQQQQQQQRRPPSAFAGPNHLHQQQQQTAGGRKHSQGYHRPVPHYATPLQRVQDVELLLAEHERNQLNRSDTYVHPGILYYLFYGNKLACLHQKVSDGSVLC
ncbi:hypothetical protein DIPPA_06802 [Diplonema papillatum]|nr:hypothetical protein DIPPA_06802 [Diplonema papillatum]